MTNQGGDHVALYTGCLNHVDGTFGMCGERWGNGRAIWCSTECMEHGLRCEGAAAVIGVIKFSEALKALCDRKPGLQVQIQYRSMTGAWGPYR